MKHTLLSRSIAHLLVLTLLSVNGFQARAQALEINTGAPNTPLYAVGPIYLSSTLFYRYSRFAYLYTQAELAAAGIVPGTIILSTGWMKSTASTAAGPAVFNIYMKNSGTASYSNATETWANLSAGAVLVYTNAAQSIPATAEPDYIDFMLNSPFTYTGGSLEILTEWDISAAPAPIATGAFEWVNTTVVDRIYASGNTSFPASLSSTFNNVSMDDRRPVIQLMVELPTGIHEELDAQVSLWPNPADGIINISNDSGASVERIEIIDARGGMTQSESPNSVATNLQLDVSKLAAGPYLVSMNTSAGRVVKRVTLR
ncbi:MAG: T9SS type A sorting domain-containing protein [Flavobacteriales bacterium]|nr:T9SS type A sorting domain-containing protein [Flavobacteriales bacterium]